METKCSCLKNNAKIGDFVEEYRDHKVGQSTVSDNFYTPFSIQSHLDPTYSVVANFSILRSQHCICAIFFTYSYYFVYGHQQTFTFSNILLDHGGLCISKLVKEP